ncbi:hypothetical protein TNCT_334461 [Trichonephila clavata]|uniref:Uncharacterized protein n=1 Tax=Trichonephila clavata TaxID=2740835 RepID=A0A8X6FKV4_TRICU|nr:hypothetical protein TNCT_334461 [Trichonephila clavata]
MAPTNDELYRDLSNLPVLDNAAPCKMHQNMEIIIHKALRHRTYYEQTLEYAQKNPRCRRPENPVVYDEDLINQRQKDIVVVNILMERLRANPPTLQHASKYTRPPNGSRVVRPIGKLALLPPEDFTFL